MNLKRNAKRTNLVGWPHLCLFKDGIARNSVRNAERSPAAPSAGWSTLVSMALVCAAAAWVPSTSQAALMAYEGFNYSTGSGNLPGQNGGFGWNGAWRRVVNGTSSILGGSLAAAGNAPSGYDSHSVGNAVFTPNGTRSGRPLDTSAGGVFGQKGYLDGNGNIGAAGKTIYISFLQQPNIANNNYYEFEFHRGDLNDPGRIGGVGCDTAGSSSVYLRTPSIGQNLIGPASTSPSLYVVRIDFLGGNDTVSVYQNPTSATEPATPTLVETGAGDMSFNGISFAAFVNGATVAHDEVRIGETWSDVVSPGTYSSGRWVGGGGNNQWSTGGNWDNGVVPVFASSLTFAGSAGLSNTNDLTGVSANGITFDAAAGAFALTGNSLGLNGNITFSGNPASPITQTISLPLVPSRDVTIDAPVNANLVLSGGVTSGSWLTKTGNGTLTLAGTNTFAALSADGGTNVITGNTTINGLGGGNKFFLADGDFIPNCKDTLIIQPGATFSVVGNFGDAGVLGRDTGSATIIQNGGLFTFNPDNQIYLFVGATSYAGTRSEYDLNGGVLDMSGKTLGLALADRGVSSTGVVNQVGGVLTNVNQMWFSTFFATGYGVYSLSGGSLYLGAGGMTTSGGYQINLGGGTIVAQASWSSALNMTLTGANGPVTFAPAGNTITLSGILSGSGGLTVSGAGILELSGANTYSGDTIVATGSTLQLDSTGSSSGSLRLANNSTLFLNFSGTYAFGGCFTNGVALPVGTYNAASLSGFISGGGTLQVTRGISAGYWTGSGADHNWSTAGNWDNNAVPIFPHALFFTNNTGLVNNNDLTGLTVSSLTFGANAGAFTLGGNDITLNDGLGFNGNPPSPVTQTVNLNMFWSVDKTIDTPSNGNLTLGGNLTTTGNNLTKTGTGTLTLGGANSFAGFSVNGGTNIVTGNTTVAGTGNSRFFVGDSGTVGTLVIQPGAALNVTGYFGDAGVLGRDSGSGFVIQNGGTFSFNPANVSYLFVGASSSAATRAEYDMNGGTLDLNNYTLAVALSANSGTLITGVVNQVSGAINNVGELDLGAFQYGPGRGIYRMTGGSIYLGANGIQSDSGVYEIYLGGGTVGAYASWSSPLNMTLTGSNGPVTFDTAGFVIKLTGTLSGPGGVTVAGGGVLELSGANAYTGDTLVNAGTLQLDAVGSSAGALRLSSGTFVNLNFNGTYLVGGFYTNGVALPNGTYNALNLPGGFIVGSGNLQVAGVSIGRWTGLGADSNWSTAGNWDHNAVPVFPIGLTFAGSTRLANNNDFTGITATSITFDSAAGAFTLGGNSLSLNGNIGFNGNPATPITQTLDLPLAPTANVNVSTPANASLVINGDITSLNNSMFKVDNGTLTLNGNNTLAGFDVDGGTAVITGNTTVAGNGSSRTYVANGDYVGGCVGTLVLANGATFTISGDLADAYVIGRDGGSGRFVQNGGTFNYNPANQNSLFIGAANNPATRAEYDMNGGLLDMNGKTLGVALGVNVLVTGVVNQVSGVITNVGQLFLDSYFSTGHSIYDLSGGSLYIGSGGITVQAGGSYEIYLGGGTVGAQANWASALDMTLTGNNGPVTFNPAGNTITLSGVLSGPGGLAVSGGGMLELSGANTYTGDTTVNPGSTLRLDSTGSTAGTFRVANGGGLHLNYIGTYTVGNLYTNGVALPNGTYSAANLAGFITGTGSVQVTGALPTIPPHLSASVSAGHLLLSWPPDYQGYILQMQTNVLGGGLTTNWFDVGGTANLTSTNITMDPSVPTAFYRLRRPTQ